MAHGSTRVCDKCVPKPCQTHAARECGERSRSDRPSTRRCVECSITPALVAETTVVEPVAIPTWDATGSGGAEEDEIAGADVAARDGTAHRRLALRGVWQRDPGAGVGERGQAGAVEGIRAAPAPGVAVADLGDGGRNHAVALPGLAAGVFAPLFLTVDKRANGRDLGGSLDLLFGVRRVGRSVWAKGAALAPVRGNTHAISAVIGTSHRQRRGMNNGSFRWQARAQRRADHHGSGNAKYRSSRGI